MERWLLFHVLLPWLLLIVRVESAESYKLPYGGVLSVKQGDTVKGGEVVPNGIHILTRSLPEVSGRVKFAGLEEGITVKTQTRIG